MIVRYGRIKEIARDMRKSFAETLGLDEHDVNLSPIEELITEIVEAYKPLILKNNRGANAGKILAKIVTSYANFLRGKSKEIKEITEEKEIETSKTKEEEKPITTEELEKELEELEKAE